MPTAAPEPAATSDRAPVKVDFALQGGGAHGAFTWGVLDRLLEEPWLQIEGISGTSAGAMNAAVMVSGYAAGGADGRASGPGGVLAQGVGGGAAQPVPARPAGRAARPLDARLLPRLHRHGPRVPAVLALRPQPGRRQPLARDPGRQRRLRAAGAGADQAVRHRDQCADRPRPRVPQRRHHARRAARLGLPADHVPGGRDRRRGLLGRRLLGQPDHDAAGPRVRAPATRSSCRSTRSSARARRAPPATSSTG